MTSRRPLTRSYSGNGRTSSFGEEEGSSSNRESRNTYLSNVRPENRSTLCTVMAQLTEDIQPSFEKTLKSKAVSENCNVKFTCVVSGIPAPELTWYKDDMEMDRYCGLPKYEIHRNGKNHTLQIYNCTLDDAAIYQASASNTKGIVSCSGVLEVGTMSEFLIHQRFFSKLKQKADNKRKELEDSKKKGKENVQKEPSEGSPQRSYRKRPVPPPPPSTEEPRAVEQIGATEAPEANGACAEMEAPGPQTATAVVVEKVEDSLSNVAAKKIKVSNGVDGVTSSGGSGKGRTIANGRQNSYDGGISLAQFLAETVSSQALEEKQAEKTCEMDTTVQGRNKEEERENEAQHKEVKDTEIVNVLVQEHERLRVNPVESPVEREKERERSSELHRPVTHPSHAPATKAHRRGHKDHDHHNIQASISSVLHTVKDFFFGKGKKDPHDHRDKEETEDTPPQTPPIPRLAEYKTQPEDVVPVRSDGSRHPSVAVATESNVDLLKPLATQAEEAEFRRKEQFPAPAPQPDRGVEPRVEEAAMSSQVDLRRPDDAVPMSGTPVLVEAKEKHLPKSLVTEEVDQTVTPPVAKAETEISPTSLISCLLQPQTPVCGEVGSMTVPSIALETDSHGHKEVASDTTSGKRPQTASAMETGPFDPQDSHSASYLQMSEKVEAQAEVQEYETRMETDLLAPANLEEKIVFDSACISELPIPMITIQADNTVLSDSMEVDYTPLIQTVNTEDPSPVTTVDISEKGDFNMQQGGVSDMFESTQRRNISEDTSSALEQHEDTVPLQEGLTSAFDQKKELNANLKLEELPLSEIESNEIQRETSQRIEGLTLTIESEFERGKEGGAFVVVQEDLNDSLSLPGARNEEVTVRLSEEAIVVADPDDTGSRLLAQNVPQSETSNTTFEDRTDIKAISPQNVSNGKMIKTCSKAEEPDLKEPMRPLLTLTTMPQMLQKDHEAVMPNVIQIDVPKTHSLTPTEAYLPHNTPTDKTQEVVQRRDKTENRKSKLHFSAHVHPVAPVPTPAINVSCAEENKLMVDVPVGIPKTEPAFNAEVSEHHKTSPLVVPPIAITCDDIPVETITVPSPPPHTATGPYQGAAPQVESPRMLQSPGKEDKINIAPPPADATTKVLSLRKKTEAISDAATREKKPMKGEDRETGTPAADHVKDHPQQPEKPPVERLEVQAMPTHPALSPASLRRFLSRVGPRSDSPTAMAVPAITVGDSQSDKTGEELSGGSTPTSSLSCESSPRLKRRDSLSLIRSATPEELASGARRKIFMPRAKGEDGGEGIGLGGTAAPGVPEAPAKWETPYMSPGQARRAALLQAPTGQNTPPLERRSPLINRRKAMLEVPKVVEEKTAEVPDSSKTEEKPAEKEKLDPFKAPQVIRKIRGEPFPDASGNLKLWCQFFNILSDSTIKWYRDEEEILHLKRSGGDESQVALAIVQPSSPDCGVYGCTIKNEYGTDTTDFLLSVDILSDMLLKEDLEVGEEVEMTPLKFTKGLADVSCWGEKFFGRIMTKESHMGQGCAHKACRIKVIYGLDPVFESGSTCIMKVQNPIPYGLKEEHHLAEKNLEMTKQEIKIQNMIREYCKIFAAEARVIENFGLSLEVIPQFLMYRPANSVPYATVEADLPGVFLRYSMMDPKGRLVTRTSSEVEQKCCSFQHWIHQWTHGNLVVTHLQGVESKLTNIRVATKSKGYQGLTEEGSPQILEQFAAQHQCNYYCGLLGLRSLKAADNLQQTNKIKGSRSPLLNRKLSTSSSPQLHRKGVPSPQTTRKAASSPKVPRKAPGTEDKNQTAKANHEGTSEVTCKT